VQQHLFDPPVVNMAINATYEDGVGWHLAIAKRREGQRWPSSGWTHYDALSTSELLDVIDTEVLNAV